MCDKLNSPAACLSRRRVPPPLKFLRVANCDLSQHESCQVIRQTKRGIMNHWPGCDCGAQGFFFGGGGVVTDA